MIDLARFHSFFGQSMELGNYLKKCPEAPIFSCNEAASVPGYIKQSVGKSSCDQSSLKAVKPFCRCIFPRQIHEWASKAVIKFNENCGTILLLFTAPKNILKKTKNGEKCAFQDCLTIRLLDSQECRTYQNKRRTYQNLSQF